MALRSWVEGRAGAALFERLAVGLSGTELQSVLLEVMQRRASQRAPRELLSQYLRDSFCRPAEVDLRTALAVDQQLLEAAAEFEAVDLSPVAPLGACSVVAPTHQHRVLSALRATEVVSDPTNVLALECAARLRRRPSATVHLATAQRVLRAQPVPKERGFAQHFRIFVLGSAAAEARDHGFTVDTIVRHVRVMLDGLARLERLGYSFGERRIDVLATAARARLGDRIADELGPLAHRELLEHVYYSGGLRYRIWVTAPDDGSSVPLIDGGAFDWVGKLAANRRAVYVASGAGSQLVALRFRPPPSDALAAAESLR